MCSPHPTRLRAALALLLSLTATAGRAQVTGTPDPAIRAHVDAFVAALRSGSADAFESMLQAHGSPELLARRTPAERRTMHERIVTDFGAISVSSVRVDDGRATIAVTGATGMAGAFELP